ncbi:MAG: peptidylprolyl isomerase [Ignavibacterium sp.]|jgi:peptidyl-prolyl cis-trans isomerase C|nr:peptidylprolyl isomerase [Ignavibacterium sp.]
MQSHLIFKIIFFVLLFAFASSAQNETEVLAKIGSYKITVEEFQNRFDFMPHLNYSSSNIDSIKKEFLYSLVAERLWALEADELDIDTYEAVQYPLKTLQKLFVKDELYKKEVESKIVLSGEEIAKGLSRVTRILNTLIITTPDSQKAFKLYDAFLNGASFDSVLQSMKIPLKEYEIKYGSLEDEGMEDILFSLKLNEISKPLLSKGNWFIFKLVSDNQDISIDPSKDHARNIVIKKLRDRKAQKLGRIYLDKLFSGRSITADRKLFDLMSDNLLQVLIDRTDKTENDTVIDVQLLEIDIRKVLSSLDPIDLNAVFIKLDEIPATIKDFLYYAIYQKVFFNSFNPTQFKKSLNQIVKKFIEDEIITREGFKLGLENLSSVKNDLQLWKNYYLSEVLMNSYADSITISDKEIKDFISIERNSTDSLQVNIIEILTNNIEDAEKILQELSDGKEFESLAQIYNQREWTKQSNGEWGFFNPKKAGEIGRIAQDLNIGQVYGPIKVNEGYSIFKLIDKRNRNDNQKSILDQDSLKFIRLTIALTKLDNLINDKTVSLARKYKINLDEQLLQKIESSEINTFTYRFIGFGGKIAAFPITVPMYNWYKQYEQNKEIP